MVSNLLDRNLRILSNTFLNLKLSFFPSIKRLECKDKKIADDKKA